MSYGPARFLTAEQVKNVATALSWITGKELRAHFDVKAMRKANLMAAECCVIWNSVNCSGRAWRAREVAPVGVKS